MELLMKKKLFLSMFSAILLLNVNTKSMITPISPICFLGKNRIVEKIKSFPVSLGISVAQSIVKKYRLYGLVGIEKIKKIIEYSYFEEINKADIYGNTPLYWACLNNNLELVKLLLEHGAQESVNKVNKYGRTPLHWACEENNINIVKLLLNNGAKESINKANKCGSTPLYWACYHNNLELVKLLLENGAKESINKANNWDSTPLYWACIKNNLELVKLLLNNGAKESINIISDGNTPLLLACEENNLELVKLLLNNGAQESVNKADIYGDIPLYMACVNNNLELVKLLLNNGAEPKVNIGNQEIKDYVNLVADFYKEKNKIAYLEKLNKKDTIESCKSLIRLLFCKVFNNKDLPANNELHELEALFAKAKNKEDGWNEIFESILGDIRSQDTFVKYCSRVYDKKENNFYFKKETINRFKTLNGLRKRKKNKQFADLCIVCK
jgi:ankyrin repeat protein